MVMLLRQVTIEYIPGRPRSIGGGRTHEAERRLKANRQSLIRLDEELEAGPGVDNEAILEEASI